MAVTADKAAPYAPGKTILDIIDRYRNRGLPSPVTSEVLARAGVPDSLLPRTMQALVTLDLLDDEGKPTPTFDSLRLSPEAEYKNRLAEWLKGTYADVFSFVDPSKDDETDIRDAFRGYHPIGQQARMVTLFQALCGAAGLMPEKPQPQRPPRASAPRPRQSPATSSSPHRAKVTTKSTAQTKITAGGELPAALAGLLASLPAEGRSWTEDQRDRFLTTFTAVLDFCFPISEAKEDAGEEEEEDE